MTLGLTAFTVVLWGAVLAVLGVFAYQVYALAVDAGWLGSSGAGGGGGPRDHEGDAEGR